MQRKALKQLGKVTQWTNERVFSGEKTQFSAEFTEFEKDIDVHRLGIERLHATSLPFFHQLTKAKPTADPYPPGSGKDKISYTEALGLVMIDYGDEIGGGYGDGLSKYGRARCKLAVAQEDFAGRLNESYIAGMENALEAVNDYKALRKKLDSRRLALDAAITKVQGSKKESYALEEEVNMARERFEEVEEETQSRMHAIQQAEEAQQSGLTDLLDAELEYHTKCREILEDLKSSWPDLTTSRPASARTRSNTVTSSRSAGRTPINRSFSKQNVAVSSEDESSTTKNRSRSQSNASASGKTKEKRSILPSFGSLGKKSGLNNTSAKRKSFGKEKYGGMDHEARALHSEEDDDDTYGDTGNSYNDGRARSQSNLSGTRISIRSDTYSAAPPPMRRVQTSPSNPNGRYVKALYDYPGDATDELRIRVGQIIEVKTEVSNDWWIGECDGRSGLFPRAYTEEYVPTPQTAVPPPMPTRPRHMPPPAGQRFLPPSHDQKTAIPPSPTFDPESELDSEIESHGFSDADHNFTASLSAAAQPTATSRAPLKKAAPPPPPSRRSQSSSNILSFIGTSASNSNSNSSSYLTPPAPAFGRTRSYTTTTRQSPSASPFAGSEDDEDHEELAQSLPQTTGLNNGLGGMHLSRPTATSGSQTGTCASCGCADFTQNVFKQKGICSTCFHAH